MGLLGSLAGKGVKLGSKVATAPASGSIAGEVGNAAGGGPAASVAGAVADVGIDGAVGALSKTGTLGRGLGVGYLGHTAFGAGKSLGDRIVGTKNDATVDAENQNQLHNQTWQRNRLQTETRGAIGDAYGAYQDKQKTQQMDTNRRLSRPMSQGYKQNVNQLQGLMSRSTQ